MQSLSSVRVGSHNVLRQAVYTLYIQRRLDDPKSPAVPGLSNNSSCALNAMRLCCSYMYSFPAVALGDVYH